MKIAPIIRAIKKHNSTATSQQIIYRLVHTGQHYDDKLSHIFFEELQLPDPDANLGAGSGTQAEQTGKIMIEFEKDLVRNPSDLVIVVGDVNSTMACTIVAKKLHTKVAHVEGGIRSFDITMPEEVNRIVTDALADYFFTTSRTANENLLRTGVREDQIFFVGNTMIDSLNFSLDKLKKPSVWSLLGLREKAYFVLTLHRPSNVDDPGKLRLLLEEISIGTAGHTVVFPVHPRTRKNFEEMSVNFPNLKGVDPLGYFEFIYLLRYAKAVITDSGGIQEETTVLKIPCVTLRNNTERPETVTFGTNELIGEDFQKLSDSLKKINNNQWKPGQIPELWDGATADRIVSAISRLK